MRSEWWRPAWWRPAWWWATRWLRLVRQLNGYLWYIRRSRTIAACCGSKEPRRPLRAWWSVPTGICVGWLCGRVTRFPSRVVGHRGPLGRYRRFVVHWFWSIHGRRCVILGSSVPGGYLDLAIRMNHIVGGAGEMQDFFPKDIILPKMAIIHPCRGYGPIWVLQ